MDCDAGWRIGTDCKMNLPKAPLSPPPSKKKITSLFANNCSLPLTGSSAFGYESFKVYCDMESGPGGEIYHLQKDVKVK